MDLHSILSLAPLLKSRLESQSAQSNAEFVSTRVKLAAALAGAIEAQPFWLLRADGDLLMMYDSASRLLWGARPDEPATLPGQWRLPTSAELTTFHSAPACPGKLPTPGFFRARGTWRTQDGEVIVGGVGDPALAGDAKRVIEISDAAVKEGAPGLISLCLERKWTLHASSDQLAPDVLAQLISPSSLREQLRQVDYRTTRLPELVDAQFADPLQGIWECWGMDETILRTQGLRARNPALDIRDWDVAIDFGTSSTVVAINEHGRRKLLRVGIGNFQEKEQASNYENPTMLEFLDWKGLLAAWTQTAYRPEVDWHHARCSHAALKDFKSSDKDLAMVGSLLMNLKRWALRAGDGQRSFVTDQRQVERELAAPAIRNPVRGVPLAVGVDDEFDPVELYAWFLGLNINWRGRGLFLRYYMTFPIDYPLQVKDQILASFRRGLQRSLPATLVQSSELARFAVEEIASEPLAYAIAALPSIGVQPSADGVAYGVFDFGGGTADFDFGIYRLPNADEDDELEQVLERKGAGGDRYLGGENLLANMAYQVFRREIATCLQFDLMFTRPADADTFPGHERVVSSGKLAQSNTVTMIEALRGLWENGDAPELLKLFLYNTKGQRGSYTFKIDKAALQRYLEQRIGEGIRSFFIDMRRAFGGGMPDCMHVLLAGNSSRSRIVGNYFGLFNDAAGQAMQQQSELWLNELFDGEPPEIKVYPALASNAEDLFLPTAKTGVALGLLRLLDRGAVKVIDESPAATEGEAPFAYYVGRIRHGKFVAAMQQGQAYRSWVELGRPRDRVLKISYTHSPLGQTSEMLEGAPGLLQMRLEFAGVSDGQFVYGRAVGPTQIEICTGTSIDQIDANAPANSRRIDLR